MTLPEQLQLVICKQLLLQASWSYLLENLPAWMHLHLLEALCRQAEHGKELDLHVPDMRSDQQVHHSTWQAQCTHGLQQSRITVPLPHPLSAPARQTVCVHLAALSLARVSLAGHGLDSAAMVLLARGLASATGLRVLDLSGQMTSDCTPLPAHCRCGQGCASCTWLETLLAAAMTRAQYAAHSATPARRSSAFSTCSIIGAAAAASAAWPMLARSCTCCG